MNGYEFTHLYQPGYVARVKAEGYRFSDVAKKVLMKVPGIRDSNPSYEESKSWIVDTTMSCDRQEALAWMNTYMMYAIAYGIETKDLDWQNKFMAAYDIMTELSSPVGADHELYSGSSPWNAPGMNPSDFIRG